MGFASPSVVHGPAASASCGSFQKRKAWALFQTQQIRVSAGGAQESGYAQV